MFKMKYMFLVLAFCAMAVACQKVKLEDPVFTPGIGSLELPISEVNLPIVYEIAKLQALINQKLDGVLYEDDSYEDKDNDRLKLKVEKSGTIFVNMVGNELYYTVPLKIVIDYNKKLLPRIVTDFSCRLRMMSHVAIGEDWKLNTKTKLLKIEWVKEPEIDLAIAKINLTKKVETILRKKESEIVKKIDVAAHDHLDIKKDMSKLWADIQKPILINKKDIQVWMVMNPKEVAASKIRGDRENIFLNLKVHTYMNSFIGEQPDFPASKLPPLKNEVTEDGNFDIFMKATFPFEPLNEALNRNIEGLDLNIQDHVLKLKKAKLLGGNDEILLQLWVGGFTSEEIFFRGKPDFDPTENLLFMRDFDFDMKTEEYILGAADWLLHDDVRNAVGEKLKISLADQIAMLSQLLENAINNAKVGKKIGIAFEDLEVDVVDMLATEMELQVLLSIKGRAAMEMRNLSN